MKILTKNLIGRALDWAVAKANGEEYRAEATWDGIGQEYQPHRYSTDPGQAYEIIDREGISVIRCDDDYGSDKYGRATLQRIPAWFAEHGGGHSVFSSYEGENMDATFMISESGGYYGPTSLIAAMRCFVAAKLGESVEIPGGALAGRLSVY